MNDHGEEMSLEDLDYDQLLMAANQFHDALHEYIYRADYAASWAAHMGSSMAEIATQLANGSRFGARSKAMELAVLQLSVLAASTIIQFQEEQEDADTVSDEFSNIVSALEDDPTFNQGGAEDAPSGTSS